MKPYLREPLVHFVLLGAALFIGDALWERWQEKTAYTIRVSPAEMQRQASLFASENRRQPSDDDLQALLFAHVEEQALMREALRLGLDADDTIIRRRLAQKMRFLVNDFGADVEPSEADLKNWFAQNRQAFTRPQKRSFDHIYLSPQKRGEEITSDALAILNKGIGEDWTALGDPFIMARSFTDVSQAGVIKDFGRAFAADVFAAPQGEWSEPIESALGLHLVRVSEITPREVPEFDAVRNEVESLWRDESAREDNAARLRALIDKYNVIIDE